jgi:hypothetical protein
VIVTAEVAGLKGQARIRVIPEVAAETPWSFDFNDGVVPVTGVGMRYRHIAIDHDYFTALKKDDPLAAKLYIYLTTQFTNVPAPKVTYDDSTPAQTFTALKRYLGLIEAITTQDQGKAQLDPSLKRLQDDKVIAKFEWTGKDKIPTQLVIDKGTRKVTGNGVMCKITTIPKGTKSQGWMGHPESKGYVITSDFMANSAPVGANADKHSKLPDVGVNNQRYRLAMLGASQQLKLYSWFPHDQKSYEVPFKWDADEWYTLKLIVTIEERKGEKVAVCKGKAWKRSESEPSQWSIEWTDSPPNYSGSPGLFGNATATEVFVDNVSVVPQ